MRCARRLFLLAALVLAALAAPAAASAATLDLTGFTISSPLLFVNENAGAAVITVNRIDTSEAAVVGYGAGPLTA